MPRLSTCFAGLALLGVSLSLVRESCGKDIIRDSVVQLHVTHRAPEYQRPWTKSEPQKATGSGVIISDNRILTNWHVVQYASQILVQLNQSTDKRVAYLEAGSSDMDLAVVRLEKPELLADYPALEMAEELPAIRSTVNAYGYPLGGDDMSVTEGIVSRIEYSNYYFEERGVRIQVDAALNPGNSGGPAVIDGKLVGLVFSKINQAENIGYLIPAEEIAAFLRDLEDGKYDGKPMLFDDVQGTENEALRDKLKLSSDVAGVLVRQPYANGREDYPLQAWDVITHIGDQAIDKQGNVQIRDDLRLDFRYLVPKLATNGTIQLTVLRNGQEPTKIDVPVTSRRTMLIPMLRGEYPDHFIWGPLAFTTVTQEFIASLGAKGYVFLTALDSPMMTRRLDRPRFEGEEMVAMANRLFPHRITKGYSNIPFGVLTHINDEEIKNLKHAVEVMRNCQDEFLTFRFGGNVETLVFRRSDLDGSTEDILSDEGIRYQASKTLQTIWDGE